VNVLPTIVCAELERAIHNPVTTVWPGLEVKACRLPLGQSWWRKTQSLGLSKQYGKNYSEVSHFLKKIFWLLLLPPAEVCDCFALECSSNPSERQASGTVLRLPARKFYCCRLHFSSAFWSECTASSLRTISACELFHAHFKALFYFPYHNIFVLVSAL